MKGLARLGTAAVVITYLHLVFGGVVRITGSGMGCGDHWPKCNGSWIPPFTDTLVMIEWPHRLLALLVVLTIAALTLLAWRQRGEPDVGGPRGVLRPAAAALVLVVTVALLGMITVKLGNTTFATLAHWTLALALLAVLVVATVRAGGLGGASAKAEGGSARTVRSIAAGAALAFIAVVLGGLVAKYPGANIACPEFPLCGDRPAGVAAGASHIQLAHRVIAYLLFFHAIAIAMAVGRRAGESAAVKRVARIAAVLVVTQLVLGAGMVLMQLHGHLRMTHQAIGVAVWLTMFLAAYLARAAEGNPRPTELAP
jgi:cytochrome c oxidase assembly protein subunit 15